jgi:ABC-type nitrate/sulfonate/bicarbonate transport system ATPase subunit
MAFRQRRRGMPLTKLLVDDVSMDFALAAGMFSALDHVNLAVPEGYFVSLIGPSGCGKSTIFNIIAGLQQPSAGRIIIDGVDATGTIGRVGYMLQKDLLLPWRTLTDNIILGMEIRGEKRAAARQRALPMLRRYGLAGFENAYPNTLSGGMRQRGALLRTLLFDTDVILLDEPFGALDAQTKARMQEWLLTLWSDFGKTVVFVTHDVDEAIFLSDEVHVMATRPGRLVASMPVALARPRQRAVTATADFIALKERCLELLHSQESVLEDAA